MNLKLQKLSKMSMAFLMALFSIWGWGQVTQHTFAATSGSITSNISFTTAQNSSSTAPGIFGDGLRLYPGGATGGGSITITPANGVVITKVKFFATQTQAVRYSINGGTAVAMAATSTYEINGSISSSLRLNNASTATSGSGNQLRLSGVEVTYQTPTSNPPVVTESSFTGSIGATFSESVQATESPSSYTLVSGSFPTGLSFNTATGAITGTPTTAGNFTANVTATNSVGTSVSPAAISFAIAKGNQAIASFTNQTKFLSSPAFTLPANTDVANLAVAYASSNQSVATISGNTVTIIGLGTTNITATQSGNNDWNAYSQQIVLTVAADPVTYTGVGRFEKITSFNNLTDGYYVFVGDASNAMTNNLSSSKLLAANISAVNNLITDPSTNIVWKIQTDAGNIKTIYNEAADRYVSGGGSNTNLALATSVSGDGQKWETSVVSNLFRFLNANQSGRALWFNGSVFGQYSTSNSSGYYDLELFKRIETTIWNGTTWSNGLPDAKDVIITGVYTVSSTTPAFTAKNITIKNGGVLEITSGNTITALDVTVENGGNFIQRDGSTLTSTSFKVLRNSESVAGKYVFWSSPVADQNLYKAYTNVPSGTAPAYVMTYDTATNLYPNVGNDDANFTANAGKGYSVKVPATNASVSFGGSAKIPNNGNVNVALSTASFGYNLIGNPYPSNIDLTAFYNANSSSIAPTMWLWDNTTGNVTTQTGNTAVNVGYATFNGPSGTWTEAPSTTGYNNATLNGIGAFAKIGQGFIVKAISAGSATFTNAIRASNTAVTLNKNLNNTEGKFWVKLTTSYGNNVTQAITYSQGASDAYDVYDSKAMGIGSDAFYSVVGTEKLVIQGRAPFNVNDVVQLGNKHFETGNFTISLSHKEGLFTNGQEIYLHDKQSGTYTNLQNGTYNFSANAGDFTNRFEIVYKLNILSTNETVKGDFEVYREGEDFVVRNHKNIQSVEVFDAAGRKIQQITANSKSVTVKVQAKGMYILKAVSEGKEYTQKIIK